jgi:hypothetical protein
MDAADRERWWWERGTAELRDLLYREWDPIGVKELADDSVDEYEAYAGQIVRRLRAGADEAEVADLLAGFRVDMGLEPADPPLDTAHRIVEWYRSARERASGP